MTRIIGLLSFVTWGEVLRFAIVGVSATITHFLALTFAVEVGRIPAAIANGIAFALAVFVTYIGQSYWVFRRPVHDVTRLKKFLITAIGGLIANVCIMLLVVNVLSLPYRIGFGIALLVVPALSFVISKTWVFADGGRESYAQTK